MTVKYFPFRFFARVLGGIWFLLILSVWALDGLGLIELRWDDYPWIILVQGLVAVAVAVRLSLALQDQIIKALRIASKKNVPELQMDDADVFESDRTEFWELDQALERIRKKMQKRRTQLAHEREESQALMSFLSEAVVSVDLSEKIKYFNSKFAAQFLPSNSPAAGMSGSSTGPVPENLEIQWSDVFREPELLEAVRRCLRQGQTETLQRSITTRLDKVERDFLIKISPLREGKSREIYGCLILFNDVSEIMKTHEIRAQFVENASHELRTPLTSIKGYLSTAQEDAQDNRWDQLPNFLSIVSKSVDRLIDLVNDMLTLSRLEGHGGLQVELVSTEELTWEVVERLSPLAAQKRIVIDTEFSAEQVTGDPKLIDQVLSNLVGNAIKYIPEGSRVLIQWSLDAGATLLRVRDNGPGIPPEHVERLFERFYRVDRGRSREVGGTGLGLAIVKHILQSHGGSVEVKSQLGTGAEFICRFPQLLVSRGRV